MSLFVIVALAIILGLYVFLFRRLAIATGWPRRTQWTIGAAIVVLTLCFVGAIRSWWAPVLSPTAARPLAWLGMTWLAFSLYLFLGLLVVAAITAVLAIRDRQGSKPQRQRVNRIGSLAAVVVALVTTTWGVVQAQEPEVTTWTAKSADLPPAFEGTTIALVSDLHLGAVRGADFAQQVVDAVNAQNPDIIVLAGDVIEGPPDRYAPEVAPLADLDADLGVFAITGNHEFISGDVPGWVDEWEKLGIVVLQNDSTLLSKDGESIRIAGVHDAQAADGFASDPQAALSQSDPDEFILYLAHQPSQAQEAQGRGIDLQVSGHTHGGQLWPMQYVVQAAQPMLDGQALVGDVPVITSRGAGTWGPPVRVGAPPEIPLITLTAG